MAVFSFGNGHFSFVKALSSQINIFPSSYSEDVSATKPSWRSVNNVFYQDLSADAMYEEFNAINSLVLDWEEPTIESTSGSNSTNDSKVPGELTPTEPSAEGDVPLQVGEEEASDPVDEANEVISPDTSTPEANDSGASDSGSDGTDSVPNEPSAPTNEAVSEPAVEAPAESTGDESSLLQGIKSGFSKISRVVDSYDLFKTSTAQAQLDASGKATFEKNIYFENFSVPFEDKNNELAKVNLRLSMAGFSENRNDKLFVFYDFLSNENKDWKVLGEFELEEKISNQILGDYFSLDIPEEMAWSKIKDLQIKISYLSEVEIKESDPIPLFIDAIWLEAKYNDAGEDALLKLNEEENIFPEELADPVEEEARRNESDGFILDLVSQKRNFKTNEIPAFDFKFERKKGLVKKIIDGIVNAFRDEYKDIKISAKIKGFRIDGAEDKGPEIRYRENGEFEVYFPKDSRSFKPGKYELEVIIEDGLDTFVSRQNFSWGVLAMNTDKTVYKPNEQAFIQMAVLDENGDTLCDVPSLLLEVRRPDGSYEYISNHNSLLVYNPACGANNVISEPDYYAYFNFADSGYYDFKLTALTKNGEYSISETIEVRDDIAFEIERSGPTRIYPKALYKMNFKVKPTADFSGDFVEKIPLNFGLEFNKDITILKKENYQELIWRVDWKKDETYEFNYVFDAPNISPEFYLFGPAIVGEFEEQRQWQIASDAPRGEIGHAFVSSDTVIDTNITTANNWTNISQYQIASSTFTPGDRYLLMINFSVQSDSEQENPLIKVQHGNTDFSDSNFAWESRWATIDTTGHGYQYFTVWTAVAGEDINIAVSNRYIGHVFTEGYQAYVMNLDEHLTENTEWYYATASHPGNLTTTWSSNGASISVDGQGHDWLVMGMGNFLSNSTAAVDFQMQLNNTSDSYTSAPVRYEGEDVDDFRPVTIMTGYTMNGTDTWRVDGRVSTAATHGWDSSKIFALDLNTFREHKIGTSSTSVAINSINTWIQTYSMTDYVVPTSGDTFVWSSEVIDVNENRKRMYSRIQVDNNTVPTGFEDSMRELPHGTNDELAHNNFFVTEMSMGTHTIDVDFYEINDVNPNPNAISHNMVAYSMELTPIAVLNVLSNEQYQGDASTIISNGDFVDGDVFLSAIASDFAAGTSSVDFYFELIATGTSFTVATSAPASFCSVGTDYEDCSSKKWKISTSTTVLNPEVKLPINNITSGDSYKWQVIVCDNPDNCSEWSKYNLTTPNFSVDSEAPTAPGALTLDSSNSNSITLNFGAESQDDFFDRYRIYYKIGTSGVTESDTEHTDANLNYIDYNGVANTTINGLTSNTDYVINIWAYDLSGRKATSTEISVKTTDALSVSARDQYKSDLLTKISNTYWTNENQINLSAISSDISEPTTAVDFYFELLDETGTFDTATSVPAASCSPGVAYNSCASKKWTIFASSSPWYSDSWLYRKKITINASQVPANLSGFPVLATTTDTALAHTSSGGHMASSTGGDIVVTDSDAMTVLDFEREYYNPATGELVLWIETDVSSTSNKDLYIYYSNPDATADLSDRAGVWDANYIMVQHLEETSGTIYDSTANANNSSLVSLTNQNASGQIDGADEFGGSASGNQIDFVNSTSFNNLGSITAEAWVNTDSTAVSNQAIFSFYRAGNDRTWMYLSDAVNGIRIYNDINNSNSDFAVTSYAPTAGEWHHVAWTINGTNWRVYVDGEEKAVESLGLTIADIGATLNVSIGSRAVENDYQWDGRLDEARISNTARSANWLRTQYNNQKDVNTFMQIGAEESTPSANGIVNISSIPNRGSVSDSSIGYKWQVIACNGSNLCSSWDSFDATTPNFRVDNSAPTAPGNLSLSTTTPTSIKLSFGATSTDPNFSLYKIFYKKGLAGVTVSDTEHTDANLSYVDYNSATTTTITGLDAYTQYVINIWAYDLAGNKTSASEIQVTTAQAPHARARSVEFVAGKYSGNGTTGKLSNTNQNFSSFNFKLAESTVEIKNAYILFESQFEAYHTGSGDYSAYNLAFDVCVEPCTANAFSGTDRVSYTDTSVLAFDEDGSNQLRLLFDVSSESQLLSYLGDGENLEGQLGYRLDTGSATSSISNAKATLILSYGFDDDGSESFTNTVIYPLASNGAGDSGSRRSSQTDDCVKNSTCPLFDYNMEIPEVTTKLAQWYKTYLVNDGHGENDVNVDVNIQSSDVDSDIFIHESKNGGEQGSLPAMIFDNVNGFTSNSSQSLEYHAESPGTATHYLMGGEVYETYTAPKSAAVKTRTVSFPIGVTTNGQSVTTASGSVDVYFPENGAGTGIVDVKKAWFRVISNNYEGVARSITVSSKVGGNIQSNNYVYNFTSGDTVVKPSFNIIHIIPATDYSELESANAINAKNITINTTNDSSNIGGVSVELMITYTYSSESSGYLSSLNLYGGQSAAAANSQISNSGVLKSVLPELRGSKTIRAGALLSSYLLGDSDADVPAAWFSLGSGISMSSPSCTNDFYHRTDGVNSFSEYYRDIKSIISVTDKQSYQTCLSNYNANDDSAGAKMNSVWLYTYQWDAPPAEFTENDWRWYENTDSLTLNTPKGNEKAKISNINIGDVLRLKMNLGISGEDLATSTQTFKLQFGKASDCTAVSDWQDVGGLSGTSAWTAYNNPSPLDGAAQTSVLLSSSDVAQTYEEVNPSASNPRSVPMGDYAEWDWVLYNKSASSSADYCFRMVKGSGAELDNYISTSYPSLATAPANTKPNNASSLGQFLSDGTVIANQSWISQNDVLLRAQTTDPNMSEVITIYYEFIERTSSFRTDTTEPVGACVSGTDYNSCASKLWYVNSASGDYRTIPFQATSSIPNITDSSVGYKWQVIACDDSAVCSNWTTFGTSPNFYIDTTAPTSPGNLIFGTSTPTSITVNFGAATSEANFSKYRLFYKIGNSGVNEGHNEQIDTNLNFIDYNEQSSTTILNLSANTEYVFNIWAYDLAGNKASATSETVGLTTSSFNPPSGSIVNATQKSDGSGAMDIVIQADDPDNDDTLRAKFFYSPGASCDFSTPNDPTLDESDENITATFGDPDIDNSADYQLGTPSNWILTSPGSNFIFFDWKTLGDIPGANDTYCLGMVLSDGIFDLATRTRLMLVDNLAPTAPGALTLNAKSYNNIVFNFGSQSTDSRFSEYKIFYKVGTGSVSTSDIEFNKLNDPNLDFVDYLGATTTMISNLTPNTDYAFNIFAFDFLGNVSSSTYINVKTNAKPTNMSADYQYKGDGYTIVPNGSWTDDNSIVLRASAHDQDSNDLVTFYYQLISTAASFSTSNTVPSGACSTGTAYSSCASGIWEVSTTTSVLPADWYHEDWLYRKKITIHASQVDSNETDFPVLATTSDMNLANFARHDAYDILFTDLSGTSTLPFERERYDYTDGELVAWVKTDISSTTDTIIYMYYGNEAWTTDMSTTTGVWTDNFRGVWHLSENVIDESSQIAVHLDSSPYLGHANQYGNNEVTAKIYQGQYFDGIDDYISIYDASALDLNTAITLDFWLNGSAMQVSSSTVIASVGDSIFVVPDGVTEISIKAWGAGGGGGAGGSNASSEGGNGGGGAFAQATFKVVPGEVLNLHIGGGGGIGLYDGATSGGGGGGGGRTELERNSNSTVLLTVASGGGGGGGDNSTSLDGGNGGAGGALSGITGGSSGTSLGGGGATLSAGGAGGTGGNNTGTAGASISGGAGADGRNGEGTDGSLNNGGITNGGDGGQATVQGAGFGAGGGGGSGYYGGGGGSSSGSTTGGGGGGGGSTYTSTLAIASSSESGSGINAANADDPDYISGVGMGGAGGASMINGTSGENGLVVFNYNLPISIAGKGTDAYRLMLDDGGTLIAGINNQNATTSINNNWHHIALTYDSAMGGTEEMKLYVDGNKVNSADYNASINQNNNDLLIGRYLDGTIDELTLSNEARSASYLKTRFRNLSNVASFMSIEEDSAVTSYYETSLIISIPDNPAYSAGFKWQAMACDDDGDCSAWDKYNLTVPNFKVDTTPPTAPGQLTESSKTSNSITLAFGNSTTEANFTEYKIYYSTSPDVDESGILISSTTDASLGYKNYNGAALTTINNLDPSTTYYFNIWAYDIVGHKASSTELIVSTNAAVSTPGAMFYTKNDQAIYYRIWTGSSWGVEQSSGNLTAAGDNIRHIRTVRSDDGGKVGILFKTWDTTNQEWWGTVYRYAANDFVDPTRLGDPYASGDNAQLMTSCIAYLSGGEFVVARTNNGSSGTLIYSWNPVDAWTTENAGPDPGAIVNGCEFERRPGTDNYLFLTFDEDADVGSAYYTGGSAYSDNWTNWTQHSSDEEDTDNYVGQAFFDPSNNTRGAISFSNSASNNYAYAKYFICDSTTINYGGQVVSPSTPTDDFGNDFVHGEFASDPGATGIAYYAGRDIGGDLNIYKVDVTNPTISWSTVANGDNISASSLYSETNDAQKPFAIEFYENGKGIVSWLSSLNATPKYRVLTTAGNTISATDTAVPGAASNVYTRVRFYNDPSVDETLAIYESDDIDYSGVFWDGGTDQFYSAGNQAWNELTTLSNAFDKDDEKTAYSFTAYNSAPNAPFGLAQYKTDASTTIANQSWTNQSDVVLTAAAIDYDTDEDVSLYIQLLANTDTFATTTSGLASACSLATDFNDCASKIWLVGNGTGDFSYTPFRATATISNLSNSSIGYKWQSIACDDESLCSAWSKFNVSLPNFKVDTVLPTAPGALTIASVSSKSVTLNFGTVSFDDNFQTYRIFYKKAASGVTVYDSEHIDVDLGAANYGGTSNTVVINLASTSQYVFNIWAFDLAGNMATATPEQATTTSASANLRQVSYLLENDDGVDVNTNTAEVLADNSLSGMNIGERVNARLQIENNGGDDSDAIVYKLQFENQTDSPGTWTDVGAETAISYSYGLSGASGDIISSSKATANTTWQNGVWFENTHHSSGYTLSKSKFSELVFAVETSNATGSKTYRLRLYDETNDRELNAYTQYPTLSMVASESIRYSKASVATLPVNRNDLTYYLDPEGYSDISTDDNANRDELSAVNEFPMYLFVVKHSNNTDAISAIWNGQSSTSTASKNIKLQVWRFGSTNAWVDLDTENTIGADSDVDLSASINSMLSEYYDASYKTYFRVYQESGTETLRSDYFDLNFSAPVPSVAQNHYRWREDDGTEATATWREPEDTGNSTFGDALGRGSSTRLRIETANTGGGSATNYTYRLEYTNSTNACLSGFGTWTPVPITATTEHFEMIDSTYFTDGDATNARLANAEGYTFVDGDMVDDTSNTSGSISLSENRYTEIEYAFMVTDNAVVAETYCFRVTNAGTALNNYTRYAAATLTGSNNTAPYISAEPSDGGSASSTPTNENTNVSFTMTAQDDESDAYYLAVCKTNAIVPGNDGQPICSGGSWCVSGPTAAGNEASCNYLATSTTEINNWYAFACDKRAGFGVADCSASSQGGGSAFNDSPFAVNHIPLFSAVSTLVANQNPGSTFTINTVSSDSDVAHAVDTLYLYVCRTNSANFAGCTGGASDTVCSATATSSPNAKCSYTDEAPTPAGENTYYAFVYDSHGLAALSNSRSSSYTINNVAPLIGTISLNDGNNISPNIKGMSEAVVGVVSNSTVDMNGCTDLLSAVSSVYISNVLNGPTCTADDNYCYQMTTASCAISDCSGDTDTSATITCTSTIKYHIMPTDDFSNNSGLNWLGYMQVSDGTNLPTAISDPVDVETNMALDVPEEVIDFGSNMYAGEDTGTFNATTTVENAGNSPIDTNLSGTDMLSSGYTIAVNNIKWGLNNFNYNTGTSLNSSGIPVDINAPKPTTETGTYDQVFWGLGIPYGADADNYNGYNTFTVMLDSDGW